MFRILTVLVLCSAIATADKIEFDGELTKLFDAAAFSAMVGSLEYDRPDSYDTVESAEWSVVTTGDELVIHESASSTVFVQSLGAVEAMSVQSFGPSGVDYLYLLGTGLLTDSPTIIDGWLGWADEEEGFSGHLSEFEHTPVLVNEPHAKGLALLGALSLAGLIRLRK